jgi:hypothetical protein
MNTHTKFQIGDLVYWRLNSKTISRELKPPDVPAVIRSINGEYARIETVDAENPALYTVLLEELKLQ